MPADDPIEGMARVLDPFAWGLHDVADPDDERLLRMPDDSLDNARAAWAYAVAAMDELYPARVARDVGPGVLETLLWAEDALEHEGIGPDLGPLIELLRLACAEVEPPAGAVTPSAAPSGGQECASVADEGDETGG